MEKRQLSPTPPKRSASPGLWEQMILTDELTTHEGYVSATPQDELLGKIGRTVTDLRPAGTAWIGDRPVDVVSEGLFLEKGQKVRVLKVEGMRVVVRPVFDED